MHCESSSLTKPLPPPIPEHRRMAADQWVLDQAPPTTETPCAVDFIPELSIVKEAQDGLDRQQTTAWWGSIAVHALLIGLLALLFAPAQLGTSVVRTLIVSLQSDSDLNSDPPPVLLDTSMEPESSLLTEIPELPEPIEVPTMPPVEAEQTTSQTAGGSQAADGRSTGIANDGTQGSFYGIQATGQSFVYVVDHSTSMNGSRYMRAKQELTRSIEELTDDQTFLVVLFSAVPRVMFDASADEAAMIPATQQNKQRLRDWLNDVGTAGGTIPTEALRTAIKQAPEAVFMLSDGEFLYRKKKRASRFLGGGHTAAEIVASVGGRIPVHTIAFEDPRSCQNMQQLAEISGGQYRFVNRHGQTCEDLVKKLDDLISSPAAGIQPEQLQAAIANAAPGLSDPTVIQRYADLVGQFFREKRSEGSTAETAADQIFDELQTLAELDPTLSAIRARFCETSRLALASLASLEPKDRMPLKRIVGLADKLSDSKATQSTLRELIDATLANEGDLEVEKVRLESLSQWPLAPMRRGSQLVRSVLCARYGEIVSQQLQRYRKNDDHISTIKLLVSQRESKAPGVIRFVSQELRDSTFDVLLQIRQTVHSRKRDEANRLKESLADAFREFPKELRDYRTLFGKRDRVSKSLLEVAEKMEAGRRRTESLQRLVKHYPRTTGGTQAREILEHEKRASAFGAPMHVPTE